MNQEQFSKQLQRLRSTYGPNKYPQDRADLIWNEFKHLAPDVFEQLVSRLIADHIAPPMSPQFRTTLAEMREKAWQGEKKQYAQEARAGYAKVMSFSEYVSTLVEKDGVGSHDFKNAVNIWGMQKIDSIYEKSRMKQRAREEQGPTHIGQLFSQGQKAYAKG